MKSLDIIVMVTLSLLELPNAFRAVKSANPAEYKLRCSNRELEAIYQNALGNILTPLDENDEKWKRAGKTTCTGKTLRYISEL
jgi:hypothetical protein